MILMIDNYDSFTYNLVQYLGTLGKRVEVYRNDRITLGEIKRMKPERIVISPGPCTPKEAGMSNEIIREYYTKVPVLGVCLGHQCIGHVFGAEIVRAKKIMHGKTSEIYHDGKGIYKGIPNPFTATRYHSLVIKKSSLPDELIVNAWTRDGVIMGVRHREEKVIGIQYHPESILTKEGMNILSNFLKL